MSSWRDSMSARSSPRGPSNPSSATRVAVACPFCYVMMDDGVKGAGKGDDVVVQDLAEMLLEAMESDPSHLDQTTLA